MTGAFLRDEDLTLYVGDCLNVLPTLADGSVDCVVTSPPYWALRDYGTPGQLGLESTPDLYVDRMVAVFRGVRRVLADHGTLWLNLGDSYASGMGSGLQGANGQRASRTFTAERMGKPVPACLKPKDLVGIPWRVAFALQADGWYLRSDIVWAKPNPMPESVTDRPTKAHEYVFLLSKRPRYWFDAEAIRAGDTPGGDNGRGVGELGVKPHAPFNGAVPAGRNVRSVWTIATQPYPEAHFATFPEELARRAVVAGCPRWVCRVCGKPRERIVADSPEYAAAKESLRSKRTGMRNNDLATFGLSQGTGTPNPSISRQTVDLGWSDCGHNDYRPGVVLDPFLGSGTTALVARKHGRRCVGIELNPDYAQLAADRTRQLSLLA